MLRLVVVRTLVVALLSAAIVSLATVAETPSPAGADPIMVAYTIPGGGGSRITVGPDGNLWFTENDANKVAKSTTTGVITEYTIPTPGSQPHGIALGSDGNLWFTERDGNKIGRITTAGVITEYPIPTAATNPFDIDAGSDGNLWFTENSGSSVGRITTAGVITEFPMPGGTDTFTITAGPDNNLWAVGGVGLNRITTAGVVTPFPTQNSAGINYLGAGPDGNLWYSAITGGFRIGTMTTSGTDVQYPYAHGLPGDVVAGPDGNVWVVGDQLVKVRLVPDPTGEFTSLTPARLLDTRPGFSTIDHVAQGGGAVGNDSSIDVQITGRGGVPTASKVSAVVLNATVTEPNNSSFLTVWPTGVTRPTISNLNYGFAQTVPNLVTVAVGTGGKVSVYNLRGSVHVILDVVGFYSTESGPLGSRFHGVSPSRDFDTRIGSGGVPAAKIDQGGTLKFNVLGKGGVPASGVTGVVMNVTITEPTGDSFLTVFPDDVSRPNASNLNFSPGLTVPNLVAVRVPANGTIDFYNSFGATHLLADVVGYYDDVKATEAGRFIPVTPFRRADTRVASPFPAPGKIPANAGVIILFPGIGVPSTGVGTMVMNVTVTEPDAGSYVTVFPSDKPLPLASNLNFGPGQTVPNHVITNVSTGPTPGGPATPGRIIFYNKFGNTHLVVDVFGYFTNDSFAANEANAAAALESGPEIALGDGLNALTAAGIANGSTARGH